LIGGGRAVFSSLFVLGSLKMSGFKVKMSKKVVISSILTFFNLMGFVIANKLTTAANAIVLQYWAPIFVILVLWLFYRKKPRNYELGFVGIAIVGIVLFFMDQMNADGVLGNIMALISGACMGMMYIVNDGIDDEAERMSAIFFGHLLTALIGVPIGLIVTPVSELTLTPFLIVVALGIFQMGVPYVLYGKAASLIGPVSVSLISMVEPILNPIWVALFYHEVPGNWAYVGAVLIIGAVTAYTVMDGKNSEK